MPVRLLAALFGFAFLAGAQRQTTYEGHPALVLSNGTLDLTVLPLGSTMVDLVLRDDPERISPLWNPDRMARESGQKSNFGGSRGHFICADGFGPVSEAERKAGLPGHGEAHQQPFENQRHEKTGATQTLSWSARLPITQETFTRTIRMTDGENAIVVESRMESLLGFDRPAFWAEHATIGSPFLEPGVTVVDMSAVRAKTRPYEKQSGGMPHRLPSDQEFTWPNAPALAGGTVDLRAAPADPNSGDHTTCLMDRSRPWAFVTALHPGKRLLLGYLIRPDEFAWVQNWEFYPANRKMARGLEFSTQPFDVPRREVVDLRQLFGAPVYRWLPAKSAIESRFVMFYTRTPEGFTKVDEARLEGGNIVVEDRKAGKTIRLKATL
jgi:hypothetical protein